MNQRRSNAATSLALADDSARRATYAVSLKLFSIATRCIQRETPGLWNCVGGITTMAAGFPSKISRENASTCAGTRGKAQEHRSQDKTRHRSTEAQKRKGQDGGVSVLIATVLCLARPCRASAAPLVLLSVPVATDTARVELQTQATLAQETQEAQGKQETP